MIHASIFKDCRLLLTQEERKKWAYVAARTFWLDNEHFWLCRWWSTVKKEIVQRQCRISVTRGTDERIARAPNGASGLRPPRAWRCPWRSLPEHPRAPAVGGRTGLRASAETGCCDGCICEVLYSCSLTLRLCKRHRSVLQACSPTTRTRTAIGSAALSAITILNSDWLELYPFMCARRC